MPSALELTEHMLPALTAAAMREADRYTIDILGIPGFTLMESAGRAVLPAIYDHFNIQQTDLSNWHVACLCGKGNNGGDGLVVARVLANAGARVSVYLLAEPQTLSPDAKKNLAILIAHATLDDTFNVTHYVLDASDSLPSHGPFDLIVDALLGTGVSRPLRAPYAAIVDWVNAQAAPVVALDIPTGLHTDLGTVANTAVRAELTVTMGAMKVGLILNEGPDHTGALAIAEIGIPRFALTRAANVHPSPYVTTQKSVATWLPKRRNNTHKYAEGMAIVVAGQAGMAGAATLAATAAARSGAGAVLCAAPVALQDVLATKMTEVMTLGLPSTQAGIDESPALTLLEKHSKKATSLLVGCGMGKKAQTQSFIRNLVEKTTLPTLIDADGLNAFVGHTAMLKAQQQPIILTPHWGEFKRLAGDVENQEDRLGLAAKYAAAWECVLVLKGAPTVVATPKDGLFISPIVNPALATAGSGDVLAGLCAGFLAQGLTAVQAALTALYLGGEAANLYTQQFHPATMLASDLIAHFNTVMNTYKS